MTLTVPPALREACAREGREDWLASLPATVQGLIESGYTVEEIYGAGQVPATIPGLLEQRQSSSSGTAELLSQAFGRGQV